MQNKYPETYVVCVISRKTNEVVKRIPCASERHAEKVERGLSINMSHKEYYTSIDRIE